ncbi:MAG: hypothetical protein H0T78_06365 [Longispora sp.]|nr:hypothetical protein [Longispora sp. (in: high G+C Gram-positive bacteria)]
MSDYEYVPLRLPPGTDRLTAQIQLTIQAEYGGWELSRLQLFDDGTRRVILRRRITDAPLPLPSPPS